MNSLLRRWPLAIKRIPKRNAALGIASLAIVGIGIAGPAMAQNKPAAAADKAPAGAPLPADAATKDATTAPAATPIPSTSSVAPVPVAPAKPVAPPQPVRAAAPFEKALFPDFRLQPNFYYCGPAATRLAITAHGQDAPSMDDLAWMLGTTENGTDSAEDTTRVLNRILGAGIYHTQSIPGGSASAAEMDRLRMDIVHAVSSGYAGVANVVGGATDLNGGWHEYDGGHYVSIVGYGQGGLTMKIADPADTQGDGSYWIATGNLANWMATRGYSA